MLQESIFGDVYKEKSPGPRFNEASKTMCREISTEILENIAKQEGFLFVMYRDEKPCMIKETANPEISLLDCDERFNNAAEKRMSKITIKDFEEMLIESEITCIIKNSPAETAGIQFLSPKPSASTEPDQSL